MVCKYCGRELADGSAICGYCGARQGGRSLWEEWAAFNETEGPVAPGEFEPEVYVSEEYAPEEGAPGEYDVPEEAESEEYVQEEIAPEEYDPEEPAPEIYEFDDYDDYDDYEDYEENRGFRRWILLLVALLILALIGAGVAFLLKSGAKPEAQAPTETSVDADMADGETAADSYAGGGAAAEDSGDAAVADGAAAGSDNEAAAGSDDEAAGGAAAEDGDTGQDDSAGEAEDGEYEDCVFPNSSSDRLTTEDLAGKSAQDLHTGINEIYARHGRIFKTKPYDTMFTDRAWYHPKAQTDEEIRAQFSDVENYNVNLLDRTLNSL